HVDLVQLVTVGQVGAHAAADDQHGDAIDKGFANAAGSVGQAGGRYQDQGASGIRDPANRVGHERRAPFMGHQNWGDLLGFVELVVDLGVVHTGNAKGITNTQLFQGIDH